MGGWGWGLCSRPWGVLITIINHISSHLSVIIVLIFVFHAMFLIAMNRLESIRMWDSDLHTPTQGSMGRGAPGPDLPPTQ